MLFNQRKPHVDVLCFCLLAGLVAGLAIADRLDAL